MTQAQLVNQLNQDTSLPALQAYVQAVINIRGFGEETPQDVLLMLMEEVGELAKAVRKTSGLPVDTAKTSQYPQVEAEAADVLILLISLCNTLGIDLLQATIDKEKINATRTWG